MLDTVLKKIFGSRNQRLLKQYRRQVAAINELEPNIQALSDADLAGRTADFRQRAANGEALDALLPEAFAVGREASKRVVGMRHFEVEMMGGLTLHQGKLSRGGTAE